MPFFEGQSVLLYNADIISDLDLKFLWDQHQESGNMATLAIRDRTSSRKLLFDQSATLRGWKNFSTGETKWCSTPYVNLEAFSFSGIHIVHPDLFEYFPDEKRFSIIDVYLQAGEMGRIKGVRHDEGAWVDAGKHSTLPTAAELIPKIPIA